MGGWGWGGMGGLVCCGGGGVGGGGWRRVGGGGVFDEISNLTVSYCTFLLSRSVFVSHFARQMNTAPNVTRTLTQANTPSRYHTQSCTLKRIPVVRVVNNILKEGQTQLSLSPFEALFVCVSPLATGSSE